MNKLFAAFTLALAVSFNAAAAAVSEPEFRELQALADTTDQAWNRRDAGALTAYYAADATSSIGPVQLSGKPAIERYFESSLKSVPAGMTHRTQLRRVEKIGDMYVADSAVFLELADAAGARRVMREFATLALFRRTPQSPGWEFMAVRAVPLK